MFIYRCRSNFSIGLIVLMSCFAFSVSAQVKWQLELKGVVYDENDLKLGGVTIILKQGGKEIDRKVTAESAPYEFKLEPNEDYTLSFSKSSYLTKIIEINTENVPPKAVVDGLFTYRANLSMLRDFPGIDHSIMDEPVVRIFYVKSTQEFGFDPEYYKIIKKRVEDMQKEYEVKLLEEKARKKEEADEKARLEKLSLDEKRKKELAELEAKRKVEEEAKRKLQEEEKERLLKEAEAKQKALEAAKILALAEAEAKKKGHKR